MPKEWWENETQRLPMKERKGLNTRQNKGGSGAIVLGKRRMPFRSTPPSGGDCTAKDNGSFARGFKDQQCIVCQIKAEATSAASISIVRVIHLSRTKA